VVVLVVVSYLFVGFYQAVMRTVSSLDEASRRMVSGDFEGTVALDNRDELGRVVRSFDSIASRLRAEWAQAQEERARATAAEALLRESEARTRLTVETALDAVIERDAQGYIREWNSQPNTNSDWSRARGGRAGGGLWRRGGRGTRASRPFAVLGPRGGGRSSPAASRSRLAGGAARSSPSSWPSRHSGRAGPTRSARSCATSATASG